VKNAVSILVIFAVVASFIGVFWTVLILFALFFALSDRDSSHWYP
jgi:hypothetical protein